MKKILFLLFACMRIAGYSQTNSVLVLSDIHLDLQMNSAAYYHTDADSNLFISVIKNAGTQKYKYIIMPGDFLPHLGTHDTGSMGTTFRYITGKVQQMDKHAILLPALGNNDCEAHNTPDKASYKIFYNSMLKWIDHDGAILKTFKEGGYYNYIDGDLSVIVLNTVLFKTGPEAEALAEMDWLDKTLHEDSASHKRVWIVYHIPPGVDRYSGKEAWLPKVEARYLAAVKQYAPIIKFQLAGHTHMNDFKLIMDKEDLISYIDITSGLDTRNGNNPAYQVLRYDERSDIINDVKTWYTDSLDKYKWHEFNFSSFDFNFIRHFESSSAKGEEFVKHYFTNRPASAGNKIHWDANFCTQSMIKVE